MPVGPLPELPARRAPRIVDEELAFSRNARATLGQLVEVPFRGAGWVFLGEMGSRKGLPYDSRRLDADGQTFIFRAEAAGTYNLKFFKQDFIADTIVNDFVQITVVDNPVTASVGGFSLPIDRGRVIAEPRWPPLVSPPTKTPLAPATPTAPPATTPTPTPTPAAASTQVKPIDDPGITREASTTMAGSRVAAPVVASSSAEATLPADAGPEALLAFAKAESDAGRTASALDTLDKYRDAFPAGSDEAWFYTPGCLKPMVLTRT
ncbi:hypothetical protein MASR2M78_17990 [Treponema sp.]